MDIDHLYLCSYNYNVGISEDGQEYVTTTFNPVENGGEYLEQFHQNRMLDQMMTLLKDVDNSINFLFKSIDNDTELITNISDLIPETGSTKHEPYNFGTLHEQVLRKNDYITGKKGIGPYALNVTNQILTQLFGVSFADTKFTRETGILRFDHLLDMDDNAVASWLSAFINAHVDIVKDPYISRLNVNPFTYNMSNLLIRSGWGSRALWFLAQPIIRDMSAANDFANSQYMKNPDATKNGENPRESAIQKAVLQHLREEDCSEAKLDSLLNGTSNEDKQNRIDAVLWVRDNQDILEELAIRPDFAKNIPDDDIVEVYFDEDGNRQMIFGMLGEQDPNHKYAVRYSRRDIQRNVFYAWKILEKYSVALGDLVQHTKVDTRKYGKNLIATRKYLQEYNSIFNAKQEESIWDVSTLKRLARGSWLDLKTNLAIQLPLTILGQQTFNANINFSNAVMQLANRLSHDGRKLDETGYMHVARSLQTAIKSEYFVKYAKEKLGMTDQDIAGLFVGNESLSRRLVNLKYLIENDPKYKRLASNAFINQIYSTLEDNPVFTNGRITDKPAFITVLDNVDQSRVNSDALSDGWLDLLNDQNKYVRDFARKMIVYAFFTSGEFKGWNKLLKYVPAEWILGEVDTDYESYASFIENKLQPGNTYTQYFDEVVSNNFMNFKYVKRMRNVNNDNTRNFINVNKGVKIGKSVKHNQINDLANYITVKKENVKGRGQDAYDLYKLIDIVKNGKNYFPVYAKIKKRGYHKTGFDIYEYGWNFNYAENEVAGADNFDFDSAIMRVTQFLADGELQMSEANQKALETVYLKPIEKVVENPQEVLIDGVKPGIYIATRGYRKGDPQKHPAFSYLFTENAQAYLTSQLVNSDEESKIFTVPGVESKKDSDLPSSVFAEVNPTAYVKLNVSDVNGTNQAGIRTNADGVVTPNAFGIVVKKNQQDILGTFLKEEGQFKDTDEDFELFKSLNEDCFNRIKNYGNKVIILPRQMALGKAALPRRFAEWLRDRLYEEFNVISKVEENKTAGYKGYGLRLVEIEDNPVTYDWQYEEDSWSTDILNELPQQNAVNRSEEFYTKQEMLDYVNDLVNVEGINRDLIDVQHFEETDNTDEYWVVSIKGQTDNESQQENLPGPETKINIYAGTGENADLSNFAERPFTITNVGEDPDGPVAGTFKTVEGAFQAQKLFYTNNYTDIEEREIISRLEKESGSEARRIGRNILGLDIKTWDELSSWLMKNLLKASFEQNPQALQRLLATGNATLTHIQGRGKWDTEFPRILMEVRDELRKQQTETNFDDENEYPSDEMNHCKH